MHRGKKSLVLDIGAEMGENAFCDLVRISDVVWDNYRVGAMERLGPDRETLKSINPRIICNSISAFEKSGKYKDLPACDIIARGITGIMSVTGETIGPPLRAGPAIADFTTGMLDEHIRKRK